MAWAEIGADASYVLTGRRTVQRPDSAAAEIEEQLTEFRRHLVADAEPQAGVLTGFARSLDGMLRFDAHLLTPELREEVEGLLAVVTDPQRLAAYRAADRVQLRARRKEIKAELASWIEPEPLYRPGETVTNLLTTFALDYGVPVKLLAELLDEIGEEAAERAAEQERAAAMLRPAR